MTNQVFTALSDSTRRAVLDTLRGGERSVAEIASLLPVTRSAVSQHLKVLQAAGLVSHRRQGTRRLYRAEGAGFLELQVYLHGWRGDILRAFRAAAERAADATEPPTA